MTTAVAQYAAPLTYSAYNLFDRRVECPHQAQLSLPQHIKRESLCTPSLTFPPVTSHLDTCIIPSGNCCTAAGYYCCCVGDRYFYDTIHGVETTMVEATEHIGDVLPFFGVQETKAYVDRTEPGAFGEVLRKPPGIYRVVMVHVRRVERLDWPALLQTPCIHFT